MQESLSQEIERALSTLTEYEREVIKMYFGIGMPHALSLDEIAMKFGLTRERVRQIKEKGIKRLRVSSKSKHLLQAHVCCFSPRHMENLHNISRSP